jgi:hypothetical protein
VFEAGGFAAIICNPPFKGGKYLKGLLGEEYVSLIRSLFDHVRGSPDLVSYFLLRSYALLIREGVIGMICTKSIFQGETRENSLDYLIGRRLARVMRAVENQKWPGEANVHIAIIWLQKCTTPRDEKTGKSERAVSEEVRGRPKKLQANLNTCFQGTNIVNGGFIVDAQWAQDVLQSSPSYSQVLFPLIEGAAMNSTPSIGWKRWIIDFHDWSLERASQFPLCLNIVKERVYPERLKSNRKRYRAFWWQFGERQEGLYKAANKLRNVIAIAYTSNTLAFAFVPSCGVVYYNATVICFERYSKFAVLQSSIHLEWVREFGSTLKGDARYAPERCFEPFPFPVFNASVLDNIGEKYHRLRSRVLSTRQEGLTKIYNSFHEPHEKSEEIRSLRALHVEMDQAVATAYGWSEMDLAHGFHETRQGVRYTMSESARHAVLDRLSALNHQRYGEEADEGFHEKKRSKSKGRERNAEAIDADLFLPRDSTTR